MKKLNFKKGILALGFIICCAGMLVSCVEEEVTPGFEKNQLIGDVIDLGGGGDGNGNGGNGGNDNADGPRGKDHDVIDIDINIP